MKKLLSWSTVRYFLEVIIILELVSAVSYFYPTVGTVAFVVGWLVALFLTIRHLEWGIYILAVDLLISSKGYLLSLSVGGFQLSWRIGIWLIIMAVWFVQLALAIYRRQAGPADFWRRLKSSGWLILLVMLFWGVINAVLRGNQPGNIFFDANGWFFWLIFLPLLSIKLWRFDRLAAVVTAGLIWLVAKTSLLLYAFSHLSSAWQYLIYHWVRDTQVGEITRMSAGFYRVFIQSQVYLLMFFAIAVWLLACRLPADRWLKWLFGREGLKWLVVLALSLLPIIIGFSRSFWFGLAIILLLLFISVWRRYHWSVAWRWSLTLIITSVISVLMIIAIVRFPWPQPRLSFNAGDILEERLGNLDSEAGASSRWSLLPKMIEAIRQAPLQGQGFGATITYRSADPRVLENDASGYYTTYAFEWGWLDIIFKFGLLLAIWYFIWLGRAGWRVWRYGQVGEGLAIGLIVLAAVHFFTPYLNHPLGIIWLAALIAWLAHHQQYDPLSNS